MTKDNSNIKDRVEIILNDIRPYLREDGGDVAYHHFEEDCGTLVLELLGSCATCPLHMMTLRAGIERLIIHEIPEVKRIEKL